MKNVLFILSLYLLSLNAFPCTDTDTFSDNVKNGVTFIKKTSHNNHDAAADLCTPFCSCHCCHVHYKNFEGITFEPINIIIPAGIFVHFDSRSEKTIKALLDPPRV